MLAIRKKINITTGLIYCLHIMQGWHDDLISIDITKLNPYTLDACYGRRNIKSACNLG